MAIGVGSAATRSPGPNAGSPKLTGKRLQRDVHRPVAELKADIMSSIDAQNGKPKPCRWTKSADAIPASVRGSVSR